MKTTAMNRAVMWKKTEGEDCGLIYYRDSERYCFSVRPETKRSVLSLVGRLAANPELSFDWFDAGRVTSAIREMMASRPLAEEESDLQDIDDWTIMLMMTLISCSGCGGLYWAVMLLI